MPADRSRYPDHWECMAAHAIARAGRRCQGCGCAHREDGTAGTILTVHHPDRDPENAEARLTVLCARCHLSVEAHARRRERIILTCEPGESIASAWRRARSGVAHEQESLEVPF